MSIEQPALLGGPEEFDEVIPVGQLYFPTWETYQAAFRDIFRRQYYTNQGPLVMRLESELAQRVGVEHAICVTNMTIGLIILAEALELSGKVILPAFTYVASAQSLRWAGLESLLCDVDIETHQIDVTAVESLISDQVSAIMGVNLWGGACDVKRLEALAADYQVPLYYDSAHGFGVRTAGRSLGVNGVAEVFSFHATKILNATEGGCICTNDDRLASRIRNIRSSYGAGEKVSVEKTANGRMSEAQAAIGLLSLSRLDETIARNRELYQRYAVGLSSIPGITLYAPSNVDESNYQYVVILVDRQHYGLSRDQLMHALWHEHVHARRYFYPGLHRTLPFDHEVTGSDLSYPNTDRLSAEILQLPIGARVDAGKVERICRLIAGFRGHADVLDSAIAAIPE